MAESDGGHALEAQFEELFRASYAGLVRSLTVAAGSQEVAADCVQEAFCRAYVRWRRVGRYDEPVAWVRRVAVNLLIDHSRRMQRHDRALARMPVDVEPPPSDPLEVDLEGALDSLTPQQRVAAALFYVEDLPVTEVAAAMKLSEGAVKYHLHQARATLRDTLDAHREDIS
ncbi:MAG TPA: sigma-70 family RNA polymerase sigma factor [Acidimicrobiia bacterium]|nr:sigma-70 family RNA polymerase sigma factor [Acidimicrobiia bacterium]